MELSKIQWFLDRLEMFSDREFLLSNDEAYTYGDLLDSVARYRADFSDLGVRPSSRVGLIGDFTQQTTAAVLALASQGAIIVPFTAGSAVEMNRGLRVSGCDLVLSDFEGGRFTSKSTVVTVTDPLFDELSRRGNPGLMLFSSGTSGSPKGILHDLAKLLERFREDRRSFRAVPMLMFDHFGGYNTIFGLMSGGSTVVSLSDRSVDTVCRAIEKHSVDLLPATPSFLSLLMATGAPSKYDLTSLKRITYGTEMMPASLLSRVARAFPGVSLQQTYGLSEVGVLSSKSESNTSTWVRVGGKGFETKVVDGTLWVKSDYSMLGYVGQRSEQEIGGWFNTHDRVEVRGEFVRFIGRDSDVINVAGQKVLPGEIENCILEIPEVVDVRVTARPHSLLGQVVHAEVVLSDPTGKIDKKSIRRHCKMRLMSYKVPQGIELVDEIGLTERLKKSRN